MPNEKTMQDDEILRRAKAEMAEAIRKLTHYKLSYWQEEDGDPLSLVDLLTPTEDETVKYGNEEIEMLADFVLSEICEPFARRELAAARDREGKLRNALRAIHNKYGPIDCVSYTRKRIMADYHEYRKWVRQLAKAVLDEEGDHLFPDDLPRELELKALAAAADQAGGGDAGN